ncbi:CLUMA_CG016611, isoform A [Clunio marinus]|uniref:CLUMA_CG016611, isoform A n=1 Tax=Clunio marinus TaxID=568069 RepID=A0A1J1IT82_9DIPT|nr:CLUMA_CG016611, isoform A [Clunio marinus]
MQALKSVRCCLAANESFHKIDVQCHDVKRSKVAGKAIFAYRFTQLENRNKYVRRLIDRYR